MKLNMADDIAASMVQNLKEVKIMLGTADKNDLAVSAPIVRSASAPTKREKIAAAMERLNYAAELYEAVGDSRRAAFVTKTMAKLAGELNDLIHQQKSDQKNDGRKIPSGPDKVVSEYLEELENVELDPQAYDMDEMGRYSRPDLMRHEDLAEEIEMENNRLAPWQDEADERFMDEKRLGIGRQEEYLGLTDEMPEETQIRVHNPTSNKYRHVLVPTSEISDTHKRNISRKPTLEDIDPDSISDDDLDPNFSRLEDFEWPEHDEDGNDEDGEARAPLLYNLATSASTVRSTKTLTKREKIAAAMRRMNYAAETYESIGNVKLAISATKKMAKLASELEDLDLENDDESLDSWFDQPEHEDFVEEFEEDIEEDTYDPGADALLNDPDPESDYQSMGLTDTSEDIERFEISPDELTDTLKWEAGVENEYDPEDNLLDLIQEKRDTREMPPPNQGYFSRGDE